MRQNYDTCETFFFMLKIKLSQENYKTIHYIKKNLSVAFLFGIGQGKKISTFTFPSFLLGHFCLKI